MTRAEHAARQRAWRKANPDRVRRYKRNWERRNRERHLAGKRLESARYRARNREKIQAKGRRYRAQAPAKCNSAVRAWRHKHATAWRAHNRKYYSEKRYPGLGEAHRMLRTLESHLSGK